MKSLKSCVGAASAAITAAASIQAEFAAEAAPTGGVISFQQIYEISRIGTPFLAAHYNFAIGIAATEAGRATRTNMAGAYDAPYLT
jgi:hypothetical protein